MGVVAEEGMCDAVGSCAMGRSVGQELSSYTNIAKRRSRLIEKVTRKGVICGEKQAIQVRISYLRRRAKFRGPDRFSVPWRFDLAHFNMHLECRDECEPAYFFCRVKWAQVRI
jgi:hypothetical protein